MVQPATRGRIRGASNVQGRSIPHSFTDPLAGIVELRRVEILDLGHRERLADFGHPLFPFLLAHQRDAIDLRAVRGRELDVIPQGFQVPTLKIVKLGQQPHFTLLGRGSVDRGHELLVVGVVQLARQLERENLLAGGGECLNHVLLRTDRGRIWFRSIHLLYPRRFPCPFTGARTNQGIAHRG
jgi:hypothetical protein